MQKIKFVLNNSAIAHIRDNDGKGLEMDFRPTQLLVFNEKTSNNRMIKDVKLDEILDTPVLTGLTENSKQYVVPLSNIDRIEANAYCHNGKNWTVFVNGNF